MKKEEINKILDNERLLEKMFEKNILDLDTILNSIEPNQIYTLVKIIIKLGDAASIYKVAYSIRYLFNTLENRRELIKDLETAITKTNDAEYIYKFANIQGSDIPKLELATILLGNAEYIYKFALNIYPSLTANHIYDAFIDNKTPKKELTNLDPANIDLICGFLVNIAYGNISCINEREINSKLKENEIIPAIVDIVKYSKFYYLDLKTECLVYVILMSRILNLTKEYNKLFINQFSSMLETIQKMDCLSLKLLQTELMKLNVNPLFLIILNTKLNSNNMVKDMCEKPIKNTSLIERKRTLY